MLFPCFRACPSSHSLRAALLAAASTVALTATAEAQWDIWNLSPPALNYSWVNSVHGGVAAGSALSGGLSRAGYWSGDIGSTWVDLQPVGAENSSVSGSSATEQVGTVNIGGQHRASRWSGSADSWLDLTPAGATSSSAYGMDGDHAVGVARFGAPQGHASLWTGGADSWIDLQPAGATSSGAFGGGGGQQAGYANFTGEWEAGYWTGTAGSFVNLHPASADSSQANNADGVHQVGQTSTDTVTHAALWSGSAASYVDLHVPGFDTSVAHDVWGAWQVGYVSNDGQTRASLWNGSAASWFDLSNELLPWFGRSSANSIWSDGDTLYIGGFADNHITGGTDAIVWTLAIPSPGGAALLAIAGGLAANRRRR